MTFFTLHELQVKGLAGVVKARAARPYSADATILNERLSEFDAAKTYDIFVSHSSLDKDTVYGLKLSLEEAGFSAYVDWIEDPVDRSKVTKANAELIRGRMRSSKSLLYATSDNADGSKWMPWELGYFDGFRQKVAICPITAGSSFDGREYLGLYPVMEKDLWLWKDGQIFKRLRVWIDEV